MRPAFILATLLGLILLAGCTGDGNRSGSCAAAQGMLGQNGVCNHQDSFSYGVQGSLTTKTDAYTWANSHAKAQVGIGGQISGGSIKVTINDAAGAQVYTKTFQGVGQAGGAEATAPGKSGAWTITIDLKAATGQLGLSVNASP